MARITVEDCVDKFPSRFELVLVASQRARKLHSGDDPTVQKNNDKNTVIALREIGDGKISLKTLEDSAINKLRKQQEQNQVVEDLEDEEDDSFDKIYKGEISRSGAAILPSKRVRKIPDKISFDDKSSEKKNIAKDKDKESEKQTKIESLPTDTQSSLPTDTQSKE